MRVGIFGDDHLDRNLPWETSDNKRYNFRKKLKKKVLEPFDLTFHLGDLTHKKNFIDGKIIDDALNIFSGKKVIYILGNHDRSKDGQQYQSLLELLNNVLEDFRVVTDIDTYEQDGVIYILSSYYAKEEDIKKEVLDVLDRKRPDQKVLVLGHWIFYNQFWDSGKRLTDFAEKLHKQGEPIKWILGHEHSPEGFPYGMYIGCLSPLEFGQKQGKIMVIEDGRYDFWNYPEGEKFIELKDTNLPDSFETPERTYLKIITDNPERTGELKDKYSHLAHCSVKYDVSETDQETKSENLDIKDEQYYFSKACESFDYDENELAPLHSKIKKEVE